MNSAKNLFDQQLGLAKWKKFDNALSRLQSPIEEQFTQTLPTLETDLLGDTPIFACKFAQKKANENWVALANEDGNLAVHDVNNQKDRYGTRAHNNAIFDLAWMFGNMKIVTASGDHTARLFDVTPTDIQEVKSFYGHTRSVKSVTFRKDDLSVFATGGRDGNIIVWDTRTDVGSFIGKADRTITGSHKRTTPRKPRRKCLGNSTSSSGAISVTGLVFQDDNTLISSGAGDGLIKIWDLRKNYVFSKRDPFPKFTIPYSGTTTKNGFSCMIMDKDCSKLYVNCLDNTIYSYNLQTYNPTPVMTYTGHQNNTFFIKSSLSPDGDYLISGSSDENAYIWSTNLSTPLVKLQGHCAEVTCVAWSHVDCFTIVTCSDDVTHRVWRVATEEPKELCDVRGITEVIQLEQPRGQAITSQLKRPSKQDICETATKIFIHPCERCASASTSRSCENCMKFKRKLELDDLDGNDSKRPNMESGPRQVFGSLDENCVITPVTNLPNYVVDGVAPHLNFSPPKKRDKDWLTKLRIERQFRKDIFTSMESQPSPPKIPKVEASPRGRCSSPQSPILRYFKVKCDGHSSSKSPGSSRVMLHNHQSSK